jgi:hypothetical protein
MSKLTREDSTLVSPERIAELKKLGYQVQDLSIEHGPDFKDEHIWIHEDGSFQDYQQSYTRRHAWFQAHTQQVQRELNAERMIAIA